MADVFISYAREDRGIAQSMAHLLEAEGVSVWWDREIGVGETFDDVVTRELSQAAATIVVWTATSVASRWVREEAEFSLDRNKLVPALCGDTTIPLGFSRLQAANLLGWNGDANHPEWGKIRTRVAQLRGAPVAPAAPAPQQPAPQPAVSAQAQSAGGFAQIGSQIDAAIGGKAAPGAAASGFNWQDLFFNPKGRIGRKPYWIATGIMIGVNLVFGLIPALGTLIGLALIYPQICVWSKRLHDMGLSGWISAGLIGATFAAVFVGAFLGVSGGEEAALLAGTLLGGLVAIGIMIWLGAAPGKAGENAYGPEPDRT